MIVFRRDEMGVSLNFRAWFRNIVLTTIAALHFKLSVANEADSPYDEADMTYTPLLDPNRDRDILQLMPDYLTEEITFSRNHAAQFYGRVVDTLMKKQRVTSEEA